MCQLLSGIKATVNMDNYHVDNDSNQTSSNTIFCHEIICPNQRLLAKSILFTAKEAKQHQRRYSTIAVNPENNLIALGWLDNKPVNFISTADTTKTVTVTRRVRNEKVQIPAPETVARYNQFMGGVDKHDKLHSTFSLGISHKLKNITSNYCCS